MEGSNNSNGVRENMNVRKDDMRHEKGQGEKEETGEKAGEKWVKERKEKE